MIFLFTMLTQTSQQTRLKKTSKTPTALQFTAHTDSPDNPNTHHILATTPIQSRSQLMQTANIYSKKKSSFSPTTRTEHQNQHPHRSSINAYTVFNSVIRNNNVNNSTEPAFAVENNTQDHAHKNSQHVYIASSNTCPLTKTVQNTSTSLKE